MGGLRIFDGINNMHAVIFQDKILLKLQSV